jgi:sulfite oxidase
MSTKMFKLYSLPSSSWNGARSVVTRNANLAARRSSSSVGVVSTLADRKTDSRWGYSTAAAAVASLLTLSGAGAVVLCEQQANAAADEVTPSHVATEDFGVVQTSHDIETMPIYTSDQVAENNGENGTPMWMSYGGVVYDVSDFIANHPGGAEKISTAGGGAIEPFWYLYRQHFASDLPMRLMEHMAVGRLAQDDQDLVDEQMVVLEEDDPYAREPMRHHALVVHSDTPMNAEIPSPLMTKNYLTPSSLFYIRNHHPVPYMTEKQVNDYRLRVDLTAYGKGVLSLTLDDLKKMDKIEVTATLQCSGNRRSGFNDLKRTSGTPWGQGAVSTAKWGGVRLADLLELAGLKNAIEAQEKLGFEHVRFHAQDEMMASIGIEKALSPYGDVIVCYEMNGEPLPRDHGYPVRIIVPGYAAVRNVKWVDKIELAKTEAEGTWQRGLNYKTLPPSVTDAKNVNLDQMPSMTEVSLFSGITNTHVISSKHKVKPGEKVVVKASGWAWAGGGRNIVRVDITSDGGKNWATAELKEGSDQRFGRAWAWVFWECEVPAVVQTDGNIELASKAVDLAFNVQPESSDHTWNVRGLGNNSWHRTTVKASK